MRFVDDKQDNAFGIADAGLEIVDDGLGRHEEDALGAPFFGSYAGSDAAGEHASLGARDTGDAKACFDLLRDERFCGRDKDNLGAFRPAEPI